MRLSLLLCALLTFVLATSGCAKPTTPPAATTDSGSDDGASGTNDAATARKNSRGLQSRPDVKAFPGVWGLQLTQLMPDRNNQPTFRDICLALIEIKGTDANTTGEVLATIPRGPKFELGSIKTAGDSITLTLKMGENEATYTGKLQSGVVRGALTLPQSDPAPAIMRPTEERTYEGWDPTPQSLGFATLQEAMKSKEQPQAVLQAAKELRGTALAINAYDSIVSRLGQHGNLKEPQIRALVADYLDSSQIWGDIFTDRAKINLAIGVTMARKFPELSLELIDAAEKNPSDLTKAWSETLTLAREQSEIDIALRGLKDYETTTQAESFEKLRALLTKQRYNPEILEALGTHAARTKQMELAKEYLADIVALPQLEGMWQQTRAGQPPGDPTPRERLLKIWEEEKGSVDGFDQFLTQTHERRMAELEEATKSAGPAVVPDPDRKRTVLVELFTGTACPPCVAGDVASAILRGTYPSSSLIVLQYHQHIPAPDPLTNLDSEDRFAYYEGGGTPTVFVDGAPVPPPGVGGVLQHVERAYTGLRTLVDARMKAETSVKIAMSASAANGVMTVSVTTEGLPEEDRSKLRLRLALTEDKIAFIAPNGIRTHECVVREMFGGAKGIGVRNNALGYSAEIPLAEIKGHLVEYLTSFESGRNTEFLVKPLDLKSLSLVAWVQNDDTRDILQAVMIPVSGDLTIPGDAAKPAEAKPVEAKPAEAKPADATAKPEGTPPEKPAEKAPEKPAEKAVDKAPEQAAEKADSPKPE